MCVWVAYFLMHQAKDVIAPLWSPHCIALCKLELGCCAEVDDAMIAQVVGERRGI